MLGLYESADAATQISENGDQTNPFSITAEGTNSNTIDTKIYVRNDDATKGYTNVIVQPYYSGGGNSKVSGQYGWGWKLYSSDVQPTESQWSSVDYGNILSFGSIITTGFTPFWVRITMPPNRSPEVLIDTFLNITYSTEYTL